MGRQKRLITKNRIFRQKRSDGKMVIAWYEERCNDYTVGVQGTSDWYGCKDIDEAEMKIIELLRKTDE